MIKAATMFTYELDDPELAKDEILAQLADKIELKKNSVGLVMCDPEFLKTGVMQAICTALPFPTAGATTLSQAVDVEAGVLMFTLMVLTSDEIEFKTMMTDSVAEDLTGNIKKTWAKEGADKGQPAMLFLFAPLLERYSGDLYISALEEVVGHVPIFGTIAIDDQLQVFDDCAPMCNGRYGHESMALVALYGDLKPRFLLAETYEKISSAQAGTITRSNDNIVYTINAKPAVTFMEELGLARNGVMDEGLQFVPLIVNMEKDPSSGVVSAVRVISSLTEEGAAVCRGAMPENSTFTFGACEKDDIIRCATDLIKKVNHMDNINVVIIFSCMARRMSLGLDMLLEARVINETMRPGLPYMMAYAGGEYCPTKADAAGVNNMFHNFSFIVCLL